MQRAAQTEGPPRGSLFVICGFSSVFRFLRLPRRTIAPNPGPNSGKATGSGAFDTASISAISCVPLLERAMSAGAEKALDLTSESVAAALSARGCHQAGLIQCIDQHEQAGDQGQHTPGPALSPS